MTNPTPRFHSPIAAPPQPLRADDVQLADVTGLPITLMQGAAAAALPPLVGTAPETPGHVAAAGPGLLARLTPSEIYLCGLAAGSTLPDAAAFNQAFAEAGLPAHATNLTHGRAVVKLAGAAAPELLRKICGLDFREQAFPSGRVQQSSAAKIKSLILRWDEAGAPTYYLHVARPFGQYFWGILLDAGQEFGLA